MRYKPPLDRMAELNGQLQPAQHHLQIAQTIGWRGNPLTASLVPKGLG